MKYRKFFVIMLVMVLLSGLAALAAPLLLQVWESQNVLLSYQNIAIIALIVIISKTLSVLLTIFREKFAKDYNKKNFLSYMNGMFHMDYDSIITQGPTNLLEKISMAVNSIYSHMTGGLINIWSSCLIALACLILMACINIGLAAVMFIAFPINYFGYKILNKKLQERSKQMQMDTGAGFQEILSYVQNIDYIKQLPEYKNLLAALASPAEKVYGSMARVNEYAQSITIVLNGISEFIQTVIMLLLVYFFSDGGVGPYSLILATLILPLYFSSLKTVVGANVNKRDFVVAKELQKDIKACKEKEGKKAIKDIKKISLNVKELELNDKKLPFSANAQLKKGDIAQVCGASGSGKSTFVKAMLKFRKATEIKYNDIAVEDITNKSLA